MGIFLCDAEDLMYFCGKMNAYANKGIAMCLVSRAAYFADLYRKSDLELKQEFLKLKDYYENLPWYSKLERLFSGTVRDMKKDIIEEAVYREKNTRRSDDWKDLFKTFADKIDNLGFKDLAQYMRGDAMGYYLKSREAQADSAR